MNEWIKQWLSIFKMVLSTLANIGCRPQQQDKYQILVSYEKIHIDPNLHNKCSLLLFRDRLILLKLKAFCRPCLLARSVVALMEHSGVHDLNVENRCSCSYCCWQTRWNKLGRSRMCPLEALGSVPCSSFHMGEVAAQRYHSDLSSDPWATCVSPLLFTTRA